MILLDPWMLACLVPVAWQLWRSRRRRQDAAVQFAASDRARALRPTWWARLHALPSVLFAAGVVAACVALARPAQRSSLPRRSIGIDILLCFDTSSSMDEPLTSAEAVSGGASPSRMDAATTAAVEFVTARTSDRIGLVRFAAYADLVCPLTLDRRAVAASLESLRPLDPDDPEDRTGIGGACARAARVLQAGSRAESRVVILFTDGLENVATDESPDEISPLEAAEVCRALGIRVYVLAAAPPATEESSATDAGMLSLRALAENTGGVFHRIAPASTADSLAEIRDVFARIDALERSELEEPRYETVDAYAPLLWFALALALLGRALSVTLWRIEP